MNPGDANVSVPLELYEGTTWRVRGTRVPLDTVVGEFLRGATAEEIALNFPTLKLADVYAVIAYYLAHRDEVDAYVERRKVAADASARQEAGSAAVIELRQRLLSRRRRDAV